MHLIEHLGAIDLGDGEVDVAITFHDSRLLLTSGDKAIGEWDRSGYQLSRADAATFVLSAEGYDLIFRPTHPDEFASAATLSLARGPGPDSKRERHSTAETGRGGSREQAPPAKPLTLVLFYLLVAGTVGMAAWALMSIVG